LRVEERDLHALYEIRQGFRQTRATRRRTQHDERPLGLEDEHRRTIERRGLGDGHLDRVRLNERCFQRRFCRDVLGQLEMHRTRTLLLRNAECLSHQGWDRRHADNLVGHLGQRRHRGDDIHHLKARLLPGANAFLACDHNHRHGAEESAGGACRQVECAGAQCRQAYARPAGEPAMCCGHERSRLFMAGYDKPD
jgi:hypothetical protein